MRSKPIKGRKLPTYDPMIFLHNYNYYDNNTNNNETEMCFFIAAHQMYVDDS